mmetsp:Transcript_109580/g.274493  ORF Transcript_109580/g.274493 Transcript_109580/m.274493 type:complete len:270 (+) Transcript_109580:1902-2711(+)
MRRQQKLRSLPHHNASVAQKSSLSRIPPMPRCPLLLRRAASPRSIERSLHQGRKSRKRGRKRRQRRKMRSRRRQTSWRRTRSKRRDRLGCWVKPQMALLQPVPPSELLTPQPMPRLQMLLLVATSASKRGLQTQLGAPYILLMPHRRHKKRRRHKRRRRQRRCRKLPRRTWQAKGRSRRAGRARQWTTGRGWSRRAKRRGLRRMKSRLACSSRQWMAAPKFRRLHQRRLARALLTLPTWRRRWDQRTQAPSWSTRHWRTTVTPSRMMAL